MLDESATVVLQLETPLKEVATVASRARAGAARVVLNAAPAARLPAALLAALDVLVVNQHEAAVIAGVLDFPSGPTSFCRAVARKFAVATIVTLGRRGAVATIGNVRHVVPAPPIDAVDTVGAGDAFVGSLACALDAGASWRVALARAVAAGSLACSAHGAQSALPARTAIERLAVAIESAIRTDRPE
jgi:ribokinase